jgi:PhzF family phenazine biosynthesis protein
LADVERRIRFVDVFGVRPLTGNPLAVCIDSEVLSAEEMLDIAQWLDLSETTFLSEAVSPDADYRVRIFTPAGELPFAGHPTLGSCHVWQGLAGDSSPEIVQECGVGLVRIRQSNGLLWFEAPALIRSGSVETAEVGRLAEVLGIEPGAILDARWVDNGPGWVGLLLRDAKAVLALQPDFSRYEGDEELEIGLVGMYPEGSEFAYEVRALFTGASGEMREDPVTGSLNASVAEWMLDEGRVQAPYLASQGARVGRSGMVHVSRDPGGSVWVGGTVFDIVDGSLQI